MQQARRMSVLGTETAFEVLARAEALSREGRDVINLGIGQPDFKTPPHVVEAGMKALRDGHHGYTPSPGIPRIREAVAADLMRHRGVEVHPDRTAFRAAIEAGALPGAALEAASGESAHATAERLMDLIAAGGAVLLRPDA